MLARQFRLRKSRDCQRVWRQGRTLQTPELRLKFCVKNFALPRVNIVIAKKILKSAVQRNYLRRRLSEIIRCNFSLLPRNCDLLVICKNAKLRELDYASLTELVTKLLQKISHF